MSTSGPQRRRSSTKPPLKRRPPPDDPHLEGVVYHRGYLKLEVSRRAETSERRGRGWDSIRKPGVPFRTLGELAPHNTLWKARTSDADTPELSAAARDREDGTHKAVRVYKFPRPTLVDPDSVLHHNNDHSRSSRRKKAVNSRDRGEEGRGSAGSGDLAGLHGGRLRRGHPGTSRSAKPSILTLWDAAADQDPNGMPRRNRQKLALAMCSTRHMEINRDRRALKQRIQQSRIRINIARSGGVPVRATSKLLRNLRQWRASSHSKKAARAFRKSWHPYKDEPEESSDEEEKAGPFALLRKRRKKQKTGGSGAGGGSGLGSTAADRSSSRQGPHSQGKTRTTELLFPELPSSRFESSLRDPTGSLPPGAAPSPKSVSRHMLDRLATEVCEDETSAMPGVDEFGGSTIGHGRGLSNEDIHALAGGDEHFHDEHYHDEQDHLGVHRHLPPPDEMDAIMSSPGTRRRSITARANREDIQLSTYSEPTNSGSRRGSLAFRHRRSSKVQAKRLAAHGVTLHTKPENVPHTTTASRRHTAAIERPQSPSTMWHRFVLGLKTRLDQLAGLTAYFDLRILYPLLNSMYNGEERQNAIKALSSMARRSRREGDLPEWLASGGSGGGSMHGGRSSKRWSGMLADMGGGAGSQEGGLDPIESYASATSRLLTSTVSSVQTVSRGRRKRGGENERDYPMSWNTHMEDLRKHAKQFVNTQTKDSLNRLLATYIQLDRLKLERSIRLQESLGLMDVERYNTIRSKSRFFTPEFKDTEMDVFRMRWAAESQRNLANRRLAEMYEWLYQLSLVLCSTTTPSRQVFLVILHLESHVNSNKNLHRRSPESLSLLFEKVKQSKPRVHMRNPEVQQIVRYAILLWGLLRSDDVQKVLAVAEFKPSDAVYQDFFRRSASSKRANDGKAKEDGADRKEGSENSASSPAEGGGGGPSGAGSGSPTSHLGIGEDGSLNQTASTQLGALPISLPLIDRMSTMGAKVRRLLRSQLNEPPSNCLAEVPEYYLRHPESAIRASRLFRRQDYNGVLPDGTTGSLSAHEGGASAATQLQPSDYPLPPEGTPTPSQASVRSALALLMYLNRPSDSSMCSLDYTWLGDEGKDAHLTEGTARLIKQNIEQLAARGEPLPNNVTSPASPTGAGRSLRPGGGRRDPRNLEIALPVDDGLISARNVGLMSPMSATGALPPEAATKPLAPRPFGRTHRARWGRNEKQERDAAPTSPSSATTTARRITPGMTASDGGGNAQQRSGALTTSPRYTHSRLRSMRSRLNEPLPASGKTGRSQPTDRRKRATAHLSTTLDAPDSSSVKRGAETEVDVDSASSAADTQAPADTSLAMHPDDLPRMLEPEVLGSRMGEVVRSKLVEAQALRSERQSQGLALPAQTRSRASSYASTEYDTFAISEDTDASHMGRHARSLIPSEVVEGTLQDYVINTLQLVWECEAIQE